MFLETRNKVSREQYDEHKALYPSVENLQEGITQLVKTNKKLKNLKFKLWAREMEAKLKERHEENASNQSSDG